MGLFKLLDEESRFPNGSDSSLVAKWQRNLNKHKHFGCVPGEENVFYIKHYAGKVTKFNLRSKTTVPTRMEHCKSASDTMQYLWRGAK